MMTVLEERALVDGYATFADFLRDVVDAERDHGPARRRLEQHQIQVRAASGASEAVPADGGFLLQPQWARQIVMRAYQESAVLSRCTEWAVQPGNTSGLKFPAIDEQSRVDGLRWGGTRGYWMNEADTMTATKPKFRQVELVPKKVGVITHLTSELLADMGALAQYVVGIFGKELAFKVTDAVLVGDGAGKPQGVLNSPATLVTPKGSAGTATIIMQNVLDMLARFWVGSRGEEVGDGDSSRKRVAWFVHSDAVSQLAQLTVAVGSGGSLSFLLDPKTMTMMGFPVIALEQCLPLGTPGDIILADFREYNLAWRERGRLDVSMHLKFTTDEQTLRLIARVDGQSGWHTPVTPQNGTVTQSPFVVLAAR